MTAPTGMQERELELRRLREAMDSHLPFVRVNRVEVEERLDDSGRQWRAGHRIDEDFFNAAANYALSIIDEKNAAIEEWKSAAMAERDRLEEQLAQQEFPATTVAALRAEVDRLKSAMEKQAQDALGVIERGLEREKRLREALAALAAEERHLNSCATLDMIPFPCDCAAELYLRQARKALGGKELREGSSPEVERRCVMDKKGPMSDAILSVAERSRIRQGINNAIRKNPTNAILRDMEALMISHDDLAAQSRQIADQAAEVERLTRIIAESKEWEKLHFEAQVEIERLKQACEVAHQLTERLAEVLRKTGIFVPRDSYVSREAIAVLAEYDKAAAQTKNSNH